MTGLRRLWPRTLFGRLALIWGVALLLSHAFTIVMAAHVRAQENRTGANLLVAQDVATAVAILERVPPAERAAWLPRLQRGSYQYRLGAIPDGGSVASKAAQGLLTLLQGELGPRYPLEAVAFPGARPGVMLRLHLSDGAPLVIAFPKAQVVWFSWPALFFTVQLILVIVFTWTAVGRATRPLAQLARAAGTLGASLKAEPIPEEGPAEVAQAAAAFNAMQRRIVDHLAERMRILAAISHDLQTPITRMRLRADLLDDSGLRAKLQDDLAGMQALVEEGIAYARSAHSVTEPLCRVDLDALVDSLVYDYLDEGKDIRRSGQAATPLTTRPHALRRILTNLVDNAFKFGEAVEIRLEAGAPDQVVLSVLDRGPGIPPEQLEAVLQPFHRIETSRNRATGGTGLGLAIAQQLALALGGTLTLANREGGGLEARLLLPAAPEAPAS